MTQLFLFMLLGFSITVYILCNWFEQMMNEMHTMFLELFERIQKLEEENQSFKKERKNR